MNYTLKQIERFWSKVDKDSSDNGCWLWKGIRVGGYGEFATARGNSKLTHRIAWELINGEIPAKLEVCHNCPNGDNRGCCNPAHLFLGTHRENMLDAVRKGIMVKTEEDREKTRGEKHGCSKLTEDDIRYIRKRYAIGDISQRELAKEMGIRQPQICAIINRVRWKYVKDSDND